MYQEEKQDKCEECMEGTIEALPVICVLLLFLCGLAMLPISIVVVNDYHATQGYDVTTCSSTALGKLTIKTPAGVASGGTITTCISDDDGNCTSNSTIELYYPPIKNYLLVEDAEISKVKSWAAGLGSGTSFQCHVDYESGEGVSALYDKIAGWYIMILVSLFAWFIVFWIGYTMYKDGGCCCCPTTSFTPPPAESSQV